MDYKTKAIPLFEAGFEPIPLKGKRPTQTNWPRLPITRNSIEKLAANGSANGNVGVRCTEGVQFLDVDISAPEAVRRIYEWILTTLCDGEEKPLRVGNWPKFGMPCRVAGLKGKARSTVYVDAHGQEQKIEVLTVGQQFVAYGIHPATGKPYEWRHGAPEEIGAANLPEWAEADVTGLLFDFLDELALEYGWQEKHEQGGNAGQEGPMALLGEDDQGAALARLKVPGATIEELRRVLFLLPAQYCDDREYWVQVGMVIHWETRGSEDGYRLFDAWSRLSDKYAGEKDTKKRWDSFRLDRPGDETVTIGTLMEWVGVDLAKVTNVTSVTSDANSTGVYAESHQDSHNPDGIAGPIAYRVRQFVGESEDEFTTFMLYQELSLKTRREKEAARIALHRMEKAGKIEKIPGKRGSYEPVSPDIDPMDLSVATKCPFPLQLPLDLSSKVNMLPGDIAVIGGTTNAGKTSFVFHLLEAFVWSLVTSFPRSTYREKLRLSLRESTVRVLPPEFQALVQKNLLDTEDWRPPDHLKDRLIDFGTWSPADRFVVNYLNVEMGAVELWGRLKSLGPESFAIMHAGIKWLKCPRAWHRHIDPHGLNVVDYLCKYDEFYTMGTDIDKIHGKLDDGIALVLIQKKDDQANPRGGEFVLERCRLAINLDKNSPHGCIATLRKVKHPVDYKHNPEGKQIDYDIREDGRLYARSDLRYVNKAERKTINKRYDEEKQRKEAGEDFYQ